jgi:hypothetical protein
VRQEGLDQLNKIQWPHRDTYAEFSHYSNFLKIHSLRIYSIFLHISLVLWIGISYIPIYSSTFMSPCIYFLARLIRLRRWRQYVTPKRGELLPDNMALCPSRFYSLSPWESHISHMTLLSSNRIKFVFGWSFLYFHSGNLWNVFLGNHTFSFQIPNVQMGPLGTATTDRPIVACPGWLCWWRIWWNEDWQGKQKYSEKTRPSATLSTTNPTWRDPGSNPGR